MDGIWRSMLFDILQGRTLLTPDRFSVFRSMKEKDNLTDCGQLPDMTTPYARDTATRRRATSDRLADQYWDDGFVFPIQVMTAEEAVGLRAELEALEAQWQNGELPQPLNTYKRVICIASCHCHAGSPLTLTF